MDLLASIDHITFFPAVPTMVNAVINHIRAAELELDKKIRLLNSGGAPIPVGLMEKTLDMGLTASEGWGMSETTSLGLANPIAMPWRAQQTMKYHHEVHEEHEVFSSVPSCPSW